MIKTLSPYYINIPFVNPITEEICSSYVLEIYVWNGDKDDVPPQPNYTITKTNPTASTETDKINIARLVNDFLDFNPTKSTTTELVDGENQVWVLTQVFYNDLPEVPQIYTIQLCLKGYGYGLSGENPQPPTNKILIPIQDYKVNRNGVFNIPILIDEPTPEELTIEITDVVENSINDYDISYTSSRTITNLTVYARDFGETEWNAFIVLGDLTSPINLDNFVSTFGDYEFQLSTFDTLTDTVVYSKIIILKL